MLSLKNKFLAVRLDFATLDKLNAIIEHKQDQVDAKITISSVIRSLILREYEKCK